MISTPARARPRSSSGCRPPRPWRASPCWYGRGGSACRRRGAPSSACSSRPRPAFCSTRPPRASTSARCEPDRGAEPHLPGPCYLPATAVWLSRRADRSLGARRRNGVVLWLVVDRSAHFGPGRRSSDAPSLEVARRHIGSSGSVLHGLLAVCRRPRGRSSFCSGSGGLSRRLRAGRSPGASGARSTPRTARPTTRLNWRGRFRGRSSGSTRRRTGVPPSTSARRSCSRRNMARSLSGTDSLAQMGTLDGTPGVERDRSAHTTASRPAGTSSS